MEEKSTSDQTITNDAPMNQTLTQKRQQIRKERNLVISLVVMFGVVFAGIWWWGTFREPIELKYCGINIADNNSQQKCKNYKLSIPFIYYSGYPLDYSKKIPNEVQSLAVAYPSMQPWHSLSLLEQWNSQKIGIEFSLVTGRTVKDLISISSLGSMTGTLKTSLAPDSVYGLAQYLDEPSPHGWQFLVPQEHNPRIYLRCPYRASNPNVNTLGCSDFMFSEWGLEIEIMHKLILLPHWSDIYDKVQLLIQSFVVPSEISGGK